MTENKITPKAPRTGFVAIVGLPNVGKSTLLNTLLGEKLAAVSKKPQTTRTRITGILTKENIQYVFLDTPGVHRPRTKLGEMMIEEIGTALADVSCVLFVTEPLGQISETERNMLAKLRIQKQNVILLINKIDEFKKSAILTTMDAFSKEFEFASIIPISAKENDGIDIIFKELDPFIGECDWYFPSDMITDMPERRIAEEIIREKLLRLLDQEIPHGTAVVVEEFKDIRGHLLSIRAEIFCEKPSHKAIIIGKDGAMLKKIGTYAREDMEAFFGVKVNLDLWVKVKKNWRDDSSYLNELGFIKKD
ncbi:MAG: GTPase Era [Oscillospiraceae bacterium]|nr:GTPase Era [Oscillospiraceae bacterium]